MTTVAVAGFTTPDITAASIAAGVGGIVIVPNLGLSNPVYDANGLTASIPNQTWIFERGVTLLRNSTAVGHVLTLAVPGLRTIGGILDGNRANNANPGAGIVAPGDGCDLEMDRTTVQNVNSYGIALNNAALIMDRVTVKATTLACLAWSSTNGSGREGPQIDRCLFDRSMEPATLASSGVLINSSDTRANFVLQPRITRSRFVMPTTSAMNAELLEMLYCQRATIVDNVFTGGRIGMTYGGNSSLGRIVGNKFQNQTSYAIELGCTDTIVEGNCGTGLGAALSLHGISVNPACSGALKVYGNTMKDFSVAVFDPSSRITAQWAN